MHFYQCENDGKSRQRKKDDANKSIMLQMIFRQSRDSQNVHKNEHFFLPAVHGQAKDRTQKRVYKINFNWSVNCRPFCFLSDILFLQLFCTYKITAYL